MLPVAGAWNSVDRHADRFDGLQRDRLSRLKIMTEAPGKAREDRYRQDADREIPFMHNTSLPEPVTDYQGGRTI